MPESKPTPKRKPGPPRTASDANRKAQGNPPLLVRLPPEELAWVRSRGGAQWVRGLISARRREEMESNHGQTN